MFLPLRMVWRWKSVKSFSCVIIILCIFFLFARFQNSTFLFSSRPFNIFEQVVKNDSYQHNFNASNISTTIKIEDILDAQRKRIALEMEDFPYTNPIGLHSLTPETNGKQIQNGKSPPLQKWHTNIFYTKIKEI